MSWRTLADAAMRIVGVTARVLARRDPWAGFDDLRRLLRVAALRALEVEPDGEG